MTWWIRGRGCREFLPFLLCHLEYGECNLLIICEMNRFGITFLGKKFDEARLIGFAYAFEQITGVRAKGKPYVTPKTEVALRRELKRRV